MRDPLHIAIDIDGVLADFVGGLLPHLSAALGREVREEHITEDYIDRALSMTPQEWADVWSRHEHRLYAEALPYADVHEGLATLSTLGRLTIQTGRPDGAAAATREWIAMHFDMPFDIHFRSGMPKYTEADRVDYFIEDHLNTALAAERGRGILIDRPWNRTGAPAHIQRMSTLIEAAAAIEADVRSLA